jgi:hypothetical protein
MDDLLKSAYLALNRNSALYFDAFLPISEMEDGQDISQWPPRLMIAEESLTIEAERNSFGDERKIRTDLARRLKALNSYRLAEIQRRRTVARRFGLVGVQYS